MGESAVHDGVTRGLDLPDHCVSAKRLQNAASLAAGLFTPALLPYRDHRRRAGGPAGPPGAIDPAPSDAYPGYQPTKGYAERKLGYGSFFYASTTEWFDQLKEIVAQGYPVQVLTDWTPDEFGPHYRVVVGYDDVKQVVYLNDPWPYGPWLDMYKKPGYRGWTWPYADFLKVWALPTDNWGLAGYNYGAVVAAPWKVQVSAPRHVAPGATFTVKVRATYRCPAPFGAGPAPAFPMFTASAVRAALELPAGFVAVSTHTKKIGATARWRPARGRRASASRCVLRSGWERGEWSSRRAVPSVARCRSGAPPIGRPPTTTPIVSAGSGASG